jgi:hypothetical protein
MIEFDAPTYEIVQEEDKNGEPRHYTIDGERVPSVTTVLRVLNKEALISWAWNVAVEGAVEVHNSGLPIDDYAAMRKALVDREWGWWQVRDTAALRGRGLHTALNHLSETGTPPSLSEFPEEQRGYVQALARWWIATEPNVLLSEAKVASKRHYYAGRTDLVVEKDVEDEILPVVVDIKSGKTDNEGVPRPPYAEAHFQVGGGYRLALLETYGHPLDAKLGAEIVNICPNGEYLVTPAFATPGDFLPVLAAYQSVKRVEGSMNAWKKQQKEIRALAHTE